MTTPDDSRPAPEDVRLTDDGRRFELAASGRIAFIDVRRNQAGALAFLHTEVPPELEGRGIGSALVRGALDRARAEGQSVLPFCPFVHAYIRRHPEYLDLVDEGYPRLEDLRRDPS